MRAFRACYMNELKKLSLKKKYIVLTIVSAVICLLTVFVSLLLGRAAGITEGAAIDSVALAILPLFTQLVMPLVAMMAVCDLFATEFQDLSIKAQLMRPVSRFKIYLAKISAVFSVCTAMFMTLFVVSVICDGVFLNNTSDVMYVFGAYIFDAVALIPLILMAVLINQFTKGSTSAMFLCIIVYVLMKLGGVFAPVLDSLFFTGYLGWHKLWLPSALPLGALLSKCFLLIGYGITFFSGGYYLFLKREF